MSLNFDSGKKKLSFTVDNDPERRVEIDATDIGMIRRYKEMSEDIEKILEKADNPEGLIEAEKAIGKAIDGIFNADVADKVFGKTSPFELSGGVMLWERFLAWIFEQMRPEIAKEYKRFNSNVNKYTSQLATLRGKK